MSSLNALTHEHDHPTALYRLQRWLRRFKERVVPPDRYQTVQMPKNLARDYSAMYGIKFRIHSDGRFVQADPGIAQPRCLANVKTGEMFIAA